MADADDQLLERLDLLIALLRISARDALTAERAELLSDPVSRVVLQSTDAWIPAGELKSRAVRETGQSEPTVKRRIAELVSRGALVRRGAGRTVSYRNSGLIEA
jgi:DNA-binding transcriptional regulator PaaX